MRTASSVLFFCLGLLPVSIAAQPVWNLTPGPVALREGPGAGRLVVGELPVGAMAEVGTCTADRSWCLLSTDGDYGWVDTRVIPVPRAAPVAAASSAPAANAAPPPPVTVTPLPDVEVGAAGLPQSVLDAVDAVSERPRSDQWVGPGRQPTLLSVTDVTVNVSTGDLNLRSGPGTTYAVIDRLAPGEGGLIDTCSASEVWCRILPMDGGPEGWAKMVFMGDRRL
ncbi:SH3 domain-containing protein [Jannaschia sp. 2305UL9-9]|uniref:SH3 domain-containing protein n=1 Tax=Jannaschia sp. 2305UL9-9 TaxID=3121638 RepID=UPI0035290645